jgi:hypothetical protein
MGRPKPPRRQSLGESRLGKDGTLLPDVRAPERAPESDVSRAAALKLAQEVGKAFAHVTLALMDLKAGGWRLPPAE